MSERPWWAPKQNDDGESECDTCGDLDCSKCQGKAVIVSPADQIGNVIAALVQTAEQKQRPGQLEELRTIARQLAGMWPHYLAGKLQPTTTDTPF